MLTVCSIWYLIVWSLLHLYMMQRILHFIHRLWQFTMFDLIVTWNILCLQVIRFQQCYIWDFNMVNFVFAGYENSKLFYLKVTCIISIIKCLTWQHGNYTMFELRETWLIFFAGYENSKLFNLTVTCLIDFLRRLWGFCNVWLDSICIYIPKGWGKRVEQHRPSCCSTCTFLWRGLGTQS